MATYKSGDMSLQIFSERETSGFDRPALVWRGYRLVQDEYTGELLHEYVQGTAGGSLKECKTNIDNLVHFEVQADDR